MTADEIEKQYQDIALQVQTDPKNSGLHYQKALILIDKSENVFSYYPELGEDYEKRAEMTHKWNIEAIEDLTHAISLQPLVKYYLKRARLYALSSLELDTSGQLEKNDSLEVIKQEPENIEALWNLARLYGNEQDDDNQIDCLKKLIKLDNSLTAYIELANTYRAIGQLTSAMTLLKEAELKFPDRLDPNHENFDSYQFEYLHKAKASIYLKKGEYDRFDEEYEDLIKIFSENTFLIDEKASDLYHADQLDAAEKEYIRWMKVLGNSSEGMGYINLGDIYKKRGDLNKAREYYQKAIDEKETDYFFMRMAEVYIELDEPDKVHEYVELSKEHDTSGDPYIPGEVEEYLKNQKKSKGGFFSKLFS